MKKKLLFIAPHLSTGGMPQYLYKQMESLINDFDIWCIEWDNVTGGVLVVQRNKILDLLGDRLITLGEDKEDLLLHIIRIAPDIVHLQEIPEMFMGYLIAEKLYDDPDRKYIIVETSHDSSFDVKNKRHFPDKFMMVSNYQIESYKSLKIPCELVEYPIEYKKRSKSKDLLLKELGLDSNKKHVIIVGLFTPRKNQAEAIQYARMLQKYPIQFHFIGNQADNFRYYWEPLMKDFPNNCKWWGERSDVDTFYQIADLFLFTSKGNSNDKETMPLVIRESISWELPSLIYNLPVYMDYFSAYKNIKYLSFTDVEKNKNAILEVLQLEKPADLKKIFIVDVYATTQTKLDLLQKCIESIKPLGIDTMIVSHCPLPDYIINSVDYYVYDKDNRFNDIYAVAYRTIDGIEVTDIISKSHSYPIVRAMKAGFSLAQNMGYEFFYFSEFDHEYSEKGLSQIKELTFSLENSGNDLVFFQPENAVFGDAVGVYYETSFFLGSISKFLDSFNSYFPKDLESFNDKFRGYFPNCLEHFFYQAFVDKSCLVYKDTVKNYFNDSVINVSSVEAIKYAILPDEEKDMYLVITNNDHILYKFYVKIEEKEDFVFYLKSGFYLIPLKRSCKIEVTCYNSNDYSIVETKSLEYDRSKYEQYKNSGSVIFHDKSRKLELGKNSHLPIKLDYKKGENKFEVSYLEDIGEPLIMSIKDINSRACIYSFRLEPAKKGAGFWVIPSPKHVIDFDNHMYFGGFVVEFWNESKLIESRDFFIKNIPIKKPVIDISNTEPVFMNYEEFFIDKVYDRYDIDNCRVVFDIGANVGLWTKYILSKNAGKVYCFEPNKKALSHLKKSLSEDKNVDIIDKAVYKENTTLKFYIDDENSLVSSILSQTGKSHSYAVEAISLKTAIEMSGESMVDLIKMDIEGAEFEIIENIDSEICDKVGSFLIEYHDFYFENGEEKVNDLINKLKYYGYKVERSTIENSKFIYASKARKNYWVNKSEQIVLRDLYNYSKDFTWEGFASGMYDSHNHIVKEVYYTFDDYTNGCVYERYDCKIENNDVVVDLGANIGVFTNYAYYKGASEVISFEPNKVAFECLLRNKPVGSKVFNMAIGDKIDHQKIYTDTYDNTMSATFLKTGDYYDDVSIYTLDYLFEKGIVNKIDFLKIDVEGYEKKVLDGINDYNLKKVKKISMEFHANYLSDKDSKDIMDRMGSLGFKTFQLFIGNGEIRFYNFWK